MVRPFTATGKPRIEKSRRRRRIRGYHRRWVYARHYGLCFLCGDFIPFHEATIDHWIPVSQNGRHSRYNMVLSCAGCNQSKADMTPADEELERSQKELDVIRGRFRKTR